MITSVLRTIDVPWLEGLDDWTYRLEAAEVSVWDGEIHCLDIGTVYKVFRDGRDELIEEPLPKGVHDTLVWFAEKYTLDHAHEIANEITTNRLDALERSQHQSDCNRRGGFASRDHCNCGRDEERLGRMA